MLNLKTDFRKQDIPEGTSKQMFNKLRHLQERDLEFKSFQMTEILNVDTRHNSLCILKFYNITYKGSYVLHCSNNRLHNIKAAYYLNDHRDHQGGKLIDAFIT